jgi:hypothetical protein
MRILKNLLVLVAFLFLAQSASAATVYVSQSGGSTSCGADGTQTTTALASVTWTAGNTYKLCGTFTFSGGVTGIEPTASGTMGNVLTIYGENNTVIQSPYFSHGGGGINIDGLSYIHITSGTPCGQIHNSVEAVTVCDPTIQDTANGDSLANQQDTTLIHAIGCTNCEVDNWNLLNAYVSDLSGAIKDNTQVVASQFSGDGNSFHNNRVINAGEGVDFAHYTTANTFHINNNYFQKIGWSLGCAGDSSLVQKVWFDDNHVTDPGVWALNAHINGIHCFNGSGGGILTLYVYNNLMDGSWNTGITSGVFLEGNISNWTTSTGKLIAFNNIFHTTDNTNPGDGWIGDFAGNGHLVFNNTFLGVNGTSYLFGVSTNGVQTATGLTFENNILQGGGQVIRDIDTPATYTKIDYNFYANSATGNPIWEFTSGCRVSSLADWQACSPSPDAHAQAQLGSPWANLNNTTGVVSTGFAGNTGGLNLTSLCSGDLVPLCSDIIGVSRPGGSTAWTVGAYQFSAGGSPTADLSPTSISFGNVTTGTTTGTSTVTLTNNGSVTLNISSIAKGGSDTTKFSLTNGCSTTLAASASCTFTVSFSPTAVTSYSANITVTTDASTSPDLVTLTGAGVAATPGGAVSGGKFVLGGTALNH